jgi:RNA polymerase sigma-70 factor (ECF subfamily)
MRWVADFLAGELTFASRLASFLHVEPEPDFLGPGGDEDWIAQCVRRAQAGDSEGYRQLFRLHVRRVHGLVRKMVGPGCDVDDLVQLIFVQAFRALPSFRGDAAFFTWLGRIAVRTTLRHARHARLRTLPMAENANAATTVSPEGVSDARRALARFDAIVASLSDKRRAAFVLHVLQGHSLEEVATMLDARVGAVKVRIHDARVEIERQARRDPYLAHYLSSEPTS